MGCEDLLDGTAASNISGAVMVGLWGRGAASTPPLGRPVPRGAPPGSTPPGRSGCGRTDGGRWGAAATAAAVTIAATSFFFVSAPPPPSFDLSLGSLSPAAAVPAVTAVDAATAVVSCRSLCCFLAFFSLSLSRPFSCLSFSLDLKWRVISYGQRCTFGYRSSDLSQPTNFLVLIFFIFSNFISKLNFKRIRIRRM